MSMVDVAAIEVVPAADDFEFARRDQSLKGSTPRR